MKYLQEDESLDDLLLNGLQIIQKTGGFRFTLDSILLAHFVTLKNGDHIVDLGTGTGIIPLVLTTRAQKLRITGIEIQPEMAEMATRSVLLNKLDEQIEIREGDLRNIHKTLGREVCHVVTANPPYGLIGDGQISPVKNKAQSRHELSCTLEEVVQAAAKLLNYQGRFALIQRAERLNSLFSLLTHYKLEPRRVRFIHPYIDKPARLVLVEARKCAPQNLQVLPPLVVYHESGRYTEEILKWYGKEGGGDAD
ncbi:MAG: tRNA1(Val) (adenine(37)-N6)-methyltransferase [Peptococcia bacterium]